MVRNDHKPLQKFLNGKNANNKVNCWSLEIATYHIAFKWVSGAHNKAEDWLSRLVEVPENDATDFSILINVITAYQIDGPSTCTCSKTSAPVMMPSDNTKLNITQLLMKDHRYTLIQMWWIDPFYKYISRWVNNGKVPHHESDTFTYMDGLPYKCAMDDSQNFLTLVIPKSWCFMVLVEAHDKLGHQGIITTYPLISDSIIGRKWTRMSINILQIAHYAGGRQQKLKGIPYIW